MISTSRGLSAAGTPDAAASPLGRRGAGAGVMADDEQRPGSLFLPRRAQRLAAVQPPDDDDEAGTSSTATTSALAV
jgi:hypothetical protein